MSNVFGQSNKKTKGTASKKKNKATKGMLRLIKEAKRKEAEARNAAYQALPLAEKLKRQVEGGKVYTKLTKA